MADQNIPEKKDMTQIINESETVGFPQEDIPSAPTEIPISSVPTVIVASENKKTPIWFYLVFVIVLICFIFMTILLGFTVKEKQFFPFMAMTTSPTPVVSSPTPFPTTITPTFSPVPTIDQAIMSLNNLRNSDEIADLELDIENTNLSSLEESLKELDRQIGFSP